MAFNLHLIFPIRDVTSADLMVLKARCLWDAGVIDDRQRKLVHHRAARFLQLTPTADGNTRTVEMPIHEPICPARSRLQVAAEATRISHELDRRVMTIAVALLNPCRCG